jgi:substrate-binding family protein
MRSSVRHRLLELSRCSTSPSKARRCSSLWLQSPYPAAKRTWIFSVPQAVPVMVSAVVDHMVVNGVKRVGCIGFTDSWGDQNYNALAQLAAAKGITVLTNERYNRVDTSVTAQVLKILATKPDAVFIGASGFAGGAAEPDALGQWLRGADLQFPRKRLARGPSGWRRCSGGNGRAHGAASRSGRVARFVSDEEGRNRLRFRLLSKMGKGHP